MQAAVHMATVPVPQSGSRRAKAGLAQGPRAAPSDRMGMLEDSYRGKTVIITGASYGVGETLAGLLASWGANLVLMARSAQVLERVAGAVREAGGEALVAAGDVRESADVQRAVDQALQRFGRIDVAVANAGIGRRHSLEETTDEVWRAIIDTNLTGAFNLCRSAGLAMREAGSGTIVTVASGLGLVGMAGQIAYCASKGGMVVMTRALAAELAPSVRVICLAPGGIETPMTDDDFAAAGDASAAREVALRRVPLGRFAESEEIASAIAAVGSGLFSYATGSVVSVDGGTTCV